MKTPHLALLPPLVEDVEVVERKGIGHPDTICDAVAEAASRALSAAYIERFGTILHHNVDKALLVGGRARPAFGGGEVLEPSVLYVAGRASEEVGGARLAVREIVAAAARGWLREHLHALEDRHLRVESLVRPGSSDLVDLFSRGAETGQQLANDTSCGVGYAPLSVTESIVVDTARRLEALARSEATPEIGEDVKVMAVRRGAHLDLTVACALIGRYLGDLDRYLERREAIAGVAREAIAASGGGFESVDVDVNAADDPDAGTVYLTVTGTSSESGDDGEVGRGNRVNGLITPGRPMTLEAAAGKNPVTHVGKLYNVAAHEIARDLVAEIPEVAYAECLLVSRIGRPIDAPMTAAVRVRLRDGAPLSRVTARAEQIVRHGVARIPSLSTRIVAGTVPLF